MLALIITSNIEDASFFKVQQKKKAELDKSLSDWEFKRKLIMLNKIEAVRAISSCPLLSSLIVFSTL
jgi:hypothetical protein